ncbi:hypothetical protein, partial [Staphylococcus aureus]
INSISCISYSKLLKNCIHSNNYLSRDYKMKDNKANNINPSKQGWLEIAERLSRKIMVMAKSNTKINVEINIEFKIK